MRIKNPFAIDLRALGALRIALAAVLFVDLGLRLPQVAAQYSDAAAFSIERARTFPSLPISLHLISGHPVYQAGLLVLAMACAGLLLVGYRTRWMCAASWYLLISLHHRSYHIQDVGDQLLRLLLLWCIFLPIGRRISVDARRAGAGVDAAPASVTSLASAGLLLQVALLYFVSVFHKLQGATWRNGEALETVLQDDVWVRPAGALLLQVPWLPRLLTYATLVVEIGAPLLLLSPFAMRVCRPLGILLLAGFALGIGACLDLGVIPWVISSALIPFLPRAVWDRLDRALGVERRPAAAGLEPDQLAASGHGRAARLFQHVIPGVLLVQMFTANLDSLHYPGRVPPAVKRIEFVLGLDQAWGMYAPDPIVISFRVHLRLDLENGDQVRLVMGSPRDGWPDGETLESLEAFWNSYRGRMLLDNIVYPQFFPDLYPFLEWVCRQWTAAHPDRPLRSIGLTKEVRSVSHTGRAPGALHAELRSDPLIGHVCSDHP